VELAVDGTHAECAAERRGQSPQPRSGAPKAPGLTASLGRSDDACRRRPHLSPPRAPPRQYGFQVRARLRPGKLRTRTTSHSVGAHG